MRKKSLLTVWLLLYLFSAGAIAGLEQSRDAIITQIKSGQFESAKSNIDKLIADNPQSPDLPEALYQIGRNYEWSDKFDEAKGFFERIVKQCPGSAAADKARLGVSRMNIYSLIISGQSGAAQAKIDKMSSDFSGNSELPDTLYWISRRYEWKDKFEEAKNVFQLIVKQYPASPEAGKARLGVSRMNICTLIVSGQAKAAQAEIDKAVSDFSGNSELPDTLFWIARRYEWKDKFEEAKNVFQLIVKQYPQSTEVSRARLGVSRMNIYTLIISGQTEAAQAEIDKMVSDFSKDPELPDTLYWVARRCEWTQNFEAEKKVLQLIIQNHPNSSYVSKAKLEYAKADVLSLIISENYEQAKVVFDKMVADFKGHQDFAPSLYWIADRYEEAKKYEEAQKIYQQIIQGSPNSVSASKARLGMARANIRSLINSEKYDNAGEAINKLIADFAGNPNLAESVRGIGYSYYEKAHMAKANGDIEGGKVLYKKAVGVWERLIREFPNSDFVPNAYYSSAVCYAQELEDYQKGIDCLQMIVNKWPNYEYAKQAQLLIVEYNDKMKNN